MWKTLRENIQTEENLINHVHETAAIIRSTDIEHDKTILTLFEADDLDDLDTDGVEGDVVEDEEFLEACKYEEASDQLHVNKKPGNMRNKDREQYDITQDGSFDDDDVINELDQ